MRGMGYYKFRREDAERFAGEQNAKTRRRGNQLQFEVCPYCNASQDKWTFAISLETGQFKCLRASCNASGNMIRLSRDFDFSLGEDVDEYYGTSRRQYRRIGNYPIPETREGAVRYLKGRGIPEEVTRKYHLTTRKDSEDVLVFPFFDEDGVMQFVKYRNTKFVKGETKGSKEWCEANCKPILFGMDQCDPEANDTLIMTEGQIDSLSVTACGIPNAVSVPGGANNFKWRPYCHNFMAKFKTLIVFGDYEKGHITLLAEMQGAFTGRLLHVRPEDYLDCKDANELLLKYGQDAVVNAVRNAVPIDDPYIRKLSEVARKSTADLQGILTDIKPLDRLIGKLYFGQLVVVTGKRGQGKSTLCSQIIARAVQQNEKCFCYSGELPAWRFQEWIDRQFAGPRYISISESNYGYRTFDVADAYAKGIHNYYDEFLYIYDSATVPKDGDERAADEKLLVTVEKAIRDYECRVVLIDNLMIAMDDVLSVDINRQQTEFVKKLAVMSQQYDALIMLIVHPRKGQYGEQTRITNDDIAGSGNITNLASVVLAYNPPRAEDLGDRTLTVIKNRLTGNTSDGIPLYFDEASKRISENERFDWLCGWEPIGSSEFQAIDDDMEDIPF